MGGWGSEVRRECGGRGRLALEFRGFVACPRNSRNYLVAAALAFAASCHPAALSAQSINILQPKPAFQSPGVHMTISALKSKTEPALVTGMDLKISNSGTIEVLLNLGDRIGGKEYPSAVRWTLIDSREKSVDLAHCWNEPRGVAGSIDDLVVILKPGGSYSAHMLFGPYCYTVPGYSKPAQGRYRISAAFTGRRQQHPDAGMKLPLLMEFWMGSLVSNTIQFEVGPQTF